MRIWNFDNFILESIDDQMPFYMSPTLTEIIEKINHPIAKDLLKIHQQSEMSNYTLIDTGLDGSDYISFVRSESLRRTVYNTFDDIERLKSRIKFHAPEAGSDLWNRGRNPIRIGRFVKKIFPEYSDTDIEKFVTMFKSENKLSKSNFKIVDGPEIGHSYQVYRYSPIYGKNNPLWHSCMNNKDFFSIYIENPEVCKMLIMTDDFIDEESGEVIEKITGRALLWKTDHGWFMDRVYYIKEETYYHFINWAKENQYLYKQVNKSVGNIKIVKNGIATNTHLKVQLKKDISEYSPYPYLDTMSFSLTIDGKTQISNEYPQNEITNIMRKNPNVVFRLIKLNDEEGSYYDFNF